MASPSQTPPATRGNLKYVVLGLLCVLAAATLWVIGSREPPPPPPAPPPAPEVARVNPMAEPELELEPEPEPEPEPEVVPEPTPKRRAGQKRGTWDCSGDLAGASKVVNGYRAQVRSCYERRLKVNNILQGDLRLKIKVGANGQVVQTAVSGSLRDNEVFACVRSLAESWTFATPSGGNCAVIDVPFSFSPKP